MTTAPTPSTDSSAQRFECMGCGAEMHYDAASGGMGCQYCGAKMAVGGAEGGQAIVEYDLEQGLARAAERGLGVEVKTTECQTCGARVSFEGPATAAVCEFCGSSQVMEQEANRNLIRPESLVPFQVPADQAKARFKSWLAGLWFRPSDLKQRARMGQITGVYVPYWTFDARADSRWTAEAGHHYYEEEKYKAPDGSVKTRRERKTRWHPAWGSRTDAYDDLLICASKGLPTEIAERLKTFDTARLVPYQPQYLAGWRAEEYALQLNDAWAQGVGKVEQSQRGRCSGDVPGDTQRNLNVATRLSEETFKHVLLPLYIASYRYGDQVYRFLVNGQTGEVEGKAPWSTVKIVLFIGLVVAIVALCAGGMSLLGSGD